MAYIKFSNSFWKLVPSYKIQLQMWQSPSDHSLPEQLLLLGGADCTAVLHFRNLTTTWPLLFFFKCIYPAVKCWDSTLASFPKACSETSSSLILFPLTSFALQVMQLVLQGIYLHWNTPLQSALGRNGSARSTEINVAARL